HDLVDRLLSETESLEDLESSLIERAVERARGNLSQAARMLGMTRPQLAYRLKKHRG
ncbi:helix-turn-helix domain-containing protein, partial [Ectothiorhodospiraceae bacterium WFHF3C12]|nr:helix-turn-helix domain-containing protein [Ectothiorhodospiraceae bacterium WFHF3C12]